MTEIPSEQKVPTKKLFPPTSREVIHFVKDKIFPGVILGTLIILPISLILFSIFLPFFGIIGIFIISIILGVCTLMFLRNGYNNTSSSSIFSRKKQDIGINTLTNKTSTSLSTSSIKSQNEMSKEIYMKKKEDYIKKWKANPNMMFMKAFAKFYCTIIVLFILVLVIPKFAELAAVLLLADIIALLYFYIKSIYSAYMLLVYKKQNTLWTWAYILFGIFGAIILIILEDKNQDLVDKGD